MKNSHSRLLTASAGLATLALALSGCSGGSNASEAGDDYPKRPVTFLNAYAAGGPSDTTARAYASCLSNELGETFAVESKVGGAGAVAMQDLASAKPDGYKIGLSTNGPMALNPLKNNLNYSMEDFRAVGTMATIPTMFVVPDGSPYKSFEELIAAAKEKPGTVTVAVTGASDSTVFELMRLKQETGIEFSVVPTNGAAEVITQLLGNHVDAAYFNDFVDAETQVKGGKMVPLVITGDSRSEAYPDVPSTKELGYDLKTTALYGLFGPKDLPDAIATKLEAALEVCSTDEKVISQIGDRFVPDSFTDGEGTMAFFEDVRARYESVAGK